MKNQIEKLAALHNIAIKYDAIILSVILLNELHS
ncbi:hypothetical protein VCRA2113O23_20517 [Vibrio crassostreae]|nr:hypothetical protein VCRA2113O23_20517 [Vibrio crassostreae]